MRKETKIYSHNEDSGAFRAQEIHSMSFKLAFPKVLLKCVKILRSYATPSLQDLSGSFQLSVFRSPFQHNGRAGGGGGTVGKVLASGAWDLSYTRRIHEQMMGI